MDHTSDDTAVLHTSNRPIECLPCGGTIPAGTPHVWTSSLDRYEARGMHVESREAYATCVACAITPSGR